MTPATALRNALRILAPLTVVLTIYLYLYPVFLGCAFPLPPQLTDDSSIRPQPSNSITSPAFHATVQQHLNASKADHAPFRLLTLGDPQLEGDTSIPNYGRNPFWHLTWAFEHLIFKTYQPSLRFRIKQILHDLIDFLFDDIPYAIEAVRKRIDLFGNDFYLAHIYRTLHWWTKPSHVTVLGDLLGSQWITDEEFERRSWRYWNRSFRGGERVPDDVAQAPDNEYEVAGLLGVEDDNAAAWRRRIINIAGNHDIGYAGDLVQSRLDRFERAFGKVSYELRFELPITNATSSATMYDAETNSESDRLIPELRIVVINNMNLDMPAVDQPLQDISYGFLNKAITTSSAVDFKGHFTIVMTHIPLYKPEGVCVDAPFFAFFNEDEGGGVKEQNQLSADASKGFLEGIYGLNGDPKAPGGGMGRPGVILNGHDHEGCDTWHYINQTLGEGEEPPASWRVARWPDAIKPGAERIADTPGVPGVREVTVRSMMGEFGGNAGLLSAWFDEETWEWRYEFVTCALGRQYLWWAVHILNLNLVVMLVLYAGLSAALGAGLVTDQWPAPLVRYVDGWKQKLRQTLLRFIQGSRKAKHAKAKKPLVDEKPRAEKKQLKQEMSKPNTQPAPHKQEAELTNGQGHGGQAAAEQPS
ncbi:ethanolamine phosphate phosphodiesterase [Microdochium nivale]|nr:ethanolamine phosphate phosphodiesterase [Microdochium nivale]